MAVGCAAASTPATRYTICGGFLTGSGALCSSRRGIAADGLLRAASPRAQRDDDGSPAPERSPNSWNVPAVHKDRTSTPSSCDAVQLFGAPGHRRRRWSRNISPPQLDRSRVASSTRRSARASSRLRDAARPRICFANALWTKQGRAPRRGCLRQRSSRST